MRTNCFNGAWFIHKPVGLTSSQVVQKIKFLLRSAQWVDRTYSIGHGGTLDPFAEGVLVVLSGTATRLSDVYLHSKKKYRAFAKLGEAMDTGDHTGEVISSVEVPKLTIQYARESGRIFVDAPYFQTPPMYSAKKINGVPLHHLARQKKEVNREAIQKKIYALTCLNITPDSFEFEVECESGTYVRTLAEDWAKKMGTQAHLTRLIRTQSSDARLDECLNFESICEHPELLKKDLIPLQRLATHIPSLELDENTATALLQGLQWPKEKCAEQIAQNPSLKFSPYVIAKLSGEPKALFFQDENGVRLQRCFPSS